MPTFQDKYSIEGFGLTYIEAARFGIPSIAGILGGALFMQERMQLHLL